MPRDRSPRERLIDRARRMRLRFPPDISDEDLRSLVHAQPATQPQKREVAALMKLVNRSVPRNLTFGEASKTIDALQDILNLDVMKRLNPEPGDLILHKGALYEILEIAYSDARRSARLEKVVIRQEGKRQRVVKTGEVVVCKLYELLEAQSLNK